MNLEKYKKDIENLVQEGCNLLNILEGANYNLLKFRDGYEVWYSEALCLIKFVLPSRIEDFKNYYENKEQSSSLKFYITFTFPRNKGMEILESFNSVEEIDCAKSLFINQLNILKSAQRRFDSSLFDIKQVVQADLFDSELEAAEELNQKGFVRGAGAIAGVVLEKHLAQVCMNHSIKVTRKDPCVSDYNQILKGSNIIEVQDWRFIQHLADLRNLCDHNKSREPEKIEVEELILGVDKISKTIF